MDIAWVTLCRNVTQIKGLTCLIGVLSEGERVERLPSNVGVDVVVATFASAEETTQTLSHLVHVTVMGPDGVQVLEKTGPVPSSEAPGRLFPGEDAYGLCEIGVGWRAEQEGCYWIAVSLNDGEAARVSYRVGLPV